MNTGLSNAALVWRKRKLKKIFMFSLTCPSVNIILMHRSKLLRQADLAEGSFPHEAPKVNRRNAGLHAVESRIRPGGGFSTDRSLQGLPGSH